jgi:hypothetical protein
VKFGVGGIVCYCFVPVVYVFYYITWVCTVGVMMALVYLAYCISGFCPPYYIIYYCCCLIFDFWANIFMIAFPCASDFFTVLRVVGRFYCKSTYLCRMSSADSFSSGETSSTVRFWGPNVC